MPLKDLEIRALKPAAKPYKKADGEGLFLLINPASPKKPDGSKLWRLAYRFAGKQRQLYIGPYPDVSLKEARVKRDDARKLLQEGTDPAAKKQGDKRARKIEAVNVFEGVARDFLDRKTRLWSPRHKANAVARLERHVFPALGNRPIAQIEGPELLAVIRKIESRGAHEMAHRVRALCGQVFRYGISCGVCSRDPAGDLRGALAPVKKTNFPAVPLEDLPALLHAIDTCEEAPACRDTQTRLATQILALTLLRTGELRKGLWEQINWSERTWSLEAEVMKKRRPHIVPLSKQVMVLLEELNELTGHSRFMFPGEGRKGVMSENTILYTLHALGYKGRMTGHGFRSLASTVLNEAGFNSDHIELQLAHVQENKVRRAYNHAKWLDQRREMLTWYADYLDELRKGRYIKPHLFKGAEKGEARASGTSQGAEVIPLRRGACA